MNKRILLAVLSIAVAAALVGVGTYAWFTDTASSTGNKFTAGTMNLQVDNGSGYGEALTAMSYANIAPGFDQSKTYILRNDGSVNGDLTLTPSNFVDLDSGKASAEPANGVRNEAVDGADMGENLDLVVTVGSTTLYTGTLEGFATHAAFDLGSVAAGASVSLTFHATVDGSVGNELMTDSASFDAAYSLVSTTRPPIYFP